MDRVKGGRSAATVYDAYTGGSSSATPPQASSNAYGQFAFWVDTSDYSPEQLFYIKVTSGSYTYTLYQVSIVQAGYLFSGGNLKYSALPTGGGTWAFGGDTTFSGGNLGLGTSPATGIGLHLLQAGGATLRLSRSDSAIGFDLGYDDSYCYIGSHGDTDAIQFRINDVEKLRLDSSGNLGLGVTPEAWYSAMVALQIGNGVSLFGRSDSFNDGYFSANAYYDGSWRYIDAYKATVYSQTGGTHVWQVAAAGALADDPINWTPALQIDNSANVSIPNGALAIGSTPATAGSLRLSTSATIAFRDAADLANITAVSKNGTTDEIYLGSDVGTASTHIRSGGVIGVTVASAGPTTLLNAGVKALETASQGILVYRGAEFIDFNADWGALGSYAFINSSTGTLATDDNLKILSDTSKLYLGASDQMSIYATSTNGVIKAEGLYLDLYGTNGVRAMTPAGETLFEAYGNGGFYTYHDNGERTRTTTDGIRITSQLSYALLDVGVADTRTGGAAFRGGATGSADGGYVTFFLADDYDAVIDSFALRAKYDDLWIGPDTDPDAFKYDGGTGEWAFTSGVVAIGTADTVRGQLNLLGHATGSSLGGVIYSYMAADYDTTYDYWRHGAMGENYVFQLVSSTKLTLLTDGGLAPVILTSAPASPTSGAFYVADGVTWDPSAKGSGPYPVFYDGSAYNALY